MMLVIFFSLIKHPQDLEAGSHHFRRYLIIEREDGLV